MTAAILVAGGAAFLAACSSGTSTSSSSNTAAPSTSIAAPSPSTHAGSPTANQATCTHVNSLRTSLEDLTHLQLSASSAAKIRTDLTNIQTELAMLKGQGGAAFSSQISSLSTSLDQVKKAAQGLSSNPSATQIQAVITSLSGLKAKSQATVAEMNVMCPKK